MTVGAVWMAVAFTVSVLPYLVCGVAALVVVTLTFQE